MSVTDGRTKKYNHMSIIGFVQTGIYRFSTRDISGESYIIRKWQKTVLRGHLVVGMNQTRDKLRSLNLHLTKKHEVARKKRVMLLVGELSLKEQEFLELSLERYFFNIWGYPFTDVCCAFCGKKFDLERELLKHLNLTNWSSMLEFIQKRSHIIVKSVSAILG